MALNLQPKAPITPEVQSQLDAARALLAQHDQLPVSRRISDGPVSLELAIYKRYTRGGLLYESDKFYNFTAEQASILLQETEDNTGRPIWRRYKAGQQKVVTQVVNEKKGVDATGDKIVPDQRDAEDLEAMGLKKIEIGSDDEISDILQNVNQGEGVEI
jgi:hypothetical protein